MTLALAASTIRSIARIKALEAAEPGAGMRQALAYGSNMGR